MFIDAPSLPGIAAVSNPDDPPPMAHLRDSLEADAPASIFSPSVARIAATEARDWSFVDCWVASQFPGRQPPPFERNADTLKTLLALISFKDTASEEARLLARIDRDALGLLSQSRDSAATARPVTMAAMRDSLLDIIEQELSKEGSMALHSMSSMAVSAKVTLPAPEQLGAAILDTQSAIFETGQMTFRAETLERHIHSEIVRANSLLNTIHDDICNLPEGLGKCNIELQRTVKAMTAQSAEYERTIATLKASAAFSDLTVHGIIQEEQDYLALLEKRKLLEKRISIFRGLPSDPELARNELNAYRKELQGITSRRDAAFQGLVERETPVKRR